MGILYEKSVWAFLIFNVVLGGGAAYLSGRAIALAWQGLGLLLLYGALLATAVRFFAFALAGETLSSVQFWLVAFLLLAIFAGLGFRVTRTSQMVTQYDWLNERRGLLNW